MMLRRVTTIDALLGLIRAEAGGSVFVDWAGRKDSPSDLSIVVGPIETDQASPSTIRTRPLALEDDWTVELICVANSPGEWEAQQVATSAESLAGAVCSVVASNPSLAGPCAHAVTVSDIQGPFTGPAESSAPGLVGVVIVTVSVHQRLEAP